MYAVLEEIENNLATLILDSKNSPIIISESELSRPYKIGDLFLVEKQGEKWVVISNEREEKQRRLMASKIKREKLLERSSKRKNDS